MMEKFLILVGSYGYVISLIPLREEEDPKVGAAASLDEFSEVDVVFPSSSVREEIPNDCFDMNALGAKASMLVHADIMRKH